MSETSQGPGWWKARGGKWYPPRSPQPQQQPSAQQYPQQPVVVQKQGRCLRWVGSATGAFIGLIALIAVIAALGGCDNDKSTTGPASGGTGSASDSPAPGERTYSVGQTAHTGDFDVTLNTVEDPYVPTNQFEAPPEGQRLVALELTLRNTSTREQTMSTLLDAELQDSKSRPWDIALAGFDRPQLDGEVAAGESRRGWIIFDVSNDATELRLRLKGNPTATSSVFVL